MFERVLNTPPAILQNIFDQMFPHLGKTTEQELHKQRIFLDCGKLWECYLQHSHLANVLIIFNWHY